MDTVELSKRMGRVLVLMDATRMSMEELLASAAEKEVHCEKCPLLKTCDNHDDDGCYITWLKYLEEGRIE
jgi:hypothetical protein